MKVLYFAWLREKTGTGQEDIVLPNTVETVDQLIDWLAEHSTAHKNAFADRSSVRVAVDQRHSKQSDSIADAEEVAFFPPVTGGR